MLPHGCIIPHHAPLAGAQPCLWVRDEKFPHEILHARTRKRAENSTQRVCLGAGCFRFSRDKAGMRTWFEITAHGGRGSAFQQGQPTAILASSHRGIRWEIVRESVLHGDDALEGEVLGTPTKWYPPRQELKQAAAKRPQIRALDEDEDKRHKWVWCHDEDVGSC
jgi:hypothetical protein